MNKTTIKRGFFCALAGLVLCLPAAMGADAEGRLPEGVDLMQRYGWSQLHWAARHGRTEEVRRLLDEGAEIEAAENLGRTPLHLAAMAGWRGTAELLLSRGADVNARDRWGATPLRRLDLLRQSLGWDRADIKNLLTDSGGVR